MNPFLGAQEAVTFQYKWPPGHAVAFAFTHTSSEQLLGIMFVGTNVAHLTVGIHTCSFNHHGNPGEWISARLFLEMKKQMLKASKSFDHFITLRAT